jgi:quinate dehydrogenase
MAYKPRLTPLLRAASAHGWDTVGGVQAMIEQGLAQQRMWAMNTVDDVVACADANLLGEEVERRARALVAEMEDIEPAEVEVDRACG